MGSWELASDHTSLTANTTPPTNITHDSTYAHGKSVVFTFKSDNTLTSVDNTVTPAQTSTGTFALLSGKIVFSESGSSSSDTASYSISGSALTISISQTSTSSGITQTSSISEVFNKL